MLADKSIVDKKNTINRLKECGIKPTTQRVEIATLLFCKPQHLSADEIFLKVNEEYDQVSQATIYNTLRILVKKGLIQELIFSSDRIYYDTNSIPHHHFIDVDTGKIIDLPYNENYRCSVVDGLDAEVVDFTLVVKGRLNQDSKKSEAY